MYSPKNKTLLLLSFFLFAAVVPSYAQQKSIQNLSVSATIPPKQSDFVFNMAATDGQTTVPQETTLSYQITYGATSEGETFPTSITVDFSDNDAPNGLPLLRYVLGSASTAYGNIQPVVDLNNDTITWNLPDLPTGTDQLTFKLQTTSNYTGGTTVPLKIQATMHNDYVNSIKTITNQAYHATSIPVEPTPTQSGPTNAATTATPVPQGNQTANPTQTQDQSPISPTIIPLPTQTPTPPASVQFNTVSFSSITQNTATIRIETNNPSTLVIRYGKSPGELTGSLTDSTETTIHNVTLTSLTPDTDYYLQITARDDQNTTITSEIFTFRTARVSAQPQVNRQSLIFTSSDLVIFATNGEETGIPTIVLPQNIVYTFRFSLNRKQPIKKLMVLIRNTNVLGITSEDTGDPSTTGVTIVDRGNGTFEGTLKSPLTKGTYELYTRIWDTNGNLNETSLAYIRVTQPLTVISQDKKPIEAAKVLFSAYNSRSKEYELMSPETFPIKNPSSTDRLGQLHLPLPQGKYKIRVSAIGFKTKEVLFHIGAFTGGDYPIITLRSEPFTIGAALTYYWQTVTDALMITRVYLKDIASSSRFFELNAMLIVVSFIFLTLFAFSSRLRIPLDALTMYFLHLLQIHHGQQIDTKIQGKIVDEQGTTPLPQTHVYLIDAHSSSIVGHATTDKDGSFVLKKLAGHPYTLQVMKENYEPITLLESDIEGGNRGGYLLSLRKHPKGSSFHERILVFFEKCLDMFFEALLLLSLGFELSLGYILGWEKATPFLIISVVNLLLWLIHLTHLHKQKGDF